MIQVNMYNVKIQTVSKNVLSSSDLSIITYLSWGPGKFTVPSGFLIIHDEEFNFLTPFFFTFNILDRCDFPEKIKENGQKLTKWWHFCRNFFEYFLLTINHHGITLWPVTKIICVLRIGIGNNGIYFQNTQKVTNIEFPSSKILPTFQHSSDIPKLLAYQCQLPTYQCQLPTYQSQ